MKTKGLSLPTKATGLKTMPAEMQAQLANKTLNECFKDGTVKEICNASGAFIVPHNTVDDLYYAIINGFAVTVSPAVVEELEELPAIIGGLTFYTGLSQKKWNAANEEDENGEFRTWFRLGMPATLDVAEEGYSIEATKTEVVE